MAYADLKLGPVDSERIDLNEDHELRYWTHELGCTAIQLLAALEAVGVKSSAVAAYLGASR